MFSSGIRGARIRVPFHSVYMAEYVAFYWVSVEKNEALEGSSNSDKCCNVAVRPSWSRTGTTDDLLVHKTKQERNNGTGELF